MPPYPKRISRAALASCGELGPIAGLRDLAEKAAGGDATAIRRACVGTDFEFVAEVAARTAQNFTEGVGEFLAGAEEQLNQLSPGVRRESRFEGEDEGKSGHASTRVIRACQFAGWRVYGALGESGRPCQWAPALPLMRN